MFIFNYFAITISLLLTSMTNINEYISADFKPFNKDESGFSIKSFFEESNFSHFPVVENNIYLGSFTNDDALFFDDEKLASDYLYSLKGFFGYKTYDLITILDLFAKNKTDIMPVLDDDKQYLGYYHVEDMITLLCELPFLNEYGGILIVSKDEDNYSLAQACQIVESSNAKILGIMISKIEDQRVEITIKINQDISDELLQSFRRYGYEIVNKHDEDSYLTKLKERSEYLDRYLNI